MWRVIFALSCIIFLSTSVARATDYDEDIKYALNQLRAYKHESGLPMLAGYSSGIGGAHGAFYLLYPYIRTHASPENARLMLKDASPVVRIAAAKCILTPSLRPLPLKYLDCLANDKEQLWVGPFHNAKQSYKVMTVAEVVEEMRKDPEFLFKHYYGEKVRMDYITEARPLQSVQPVNAPLPEFPHEMRRANMSGYVTVRFTVNENGSVGEVFIIKSPLKEFERPVKKAVSKWRFSFSDQLPQEKRTPIVLECKFTFYFEND
ncbi:energy transducer TonB [Ereboglobus luteus]|uniref:TonB C-terminal domain-containing protein n=1 Tax=Ereboglobus luteus TaxID=1796921 RepID=A0A2U8DZR3_9BACT|nr:energy transducer TonB [Ereboglobus luteus]AWI07944.1 hypothetical protein CKA38_00525 [Ereboglobus luteus]